LFNGCNFSETAFASMLCYVSVVLFFFHVVQLKLHIIEIECIF